MEGFTLDQFTPLNGWMLVEMDPLSEKTEGGLLYKPSPDSKEHLLRKGTVLKVSDGWVYKPDGRCRPLSCPLKPQARILFSALHGDKIYFRHFKDMLGSENYVLLKPEDVLLYDDSELEGLGLDDVVLGGRHL